MIVLLRAAWKSDLGSMIEMEVLQPNQRLFEVIISLVKKKVVNYLTARG